MAKETEKDSLADFDAQLKELTEEVERYSQQAKTAASSLTEQPREVDYEADKNQPNHELRDRIIDLEKQFGEFSKQLSESVSGLAEQISKKISLESANEKLFDAMHKELRTYKEDTLVDSLQKPFLLDLITLYDTVEMVFSQLSTEELGEQVAQPRDNLENILHFIDEMLARHSVERIELASGKLDGRYQRAVGFEEVTDVDKKDMVLEVRRCGYRWRERILRPENVVIGRLAKNPVNENEQEIDREAAP